MHRPQPANGGRDVIRGTGAGVLGKGRSSLVSDDTLFQIGDVMGLDERRCRFASSPFRRLYTVYQNNIIDTPSTNGCDAGAARTHLWAILQSATRPPRQLVNREMEVWTRMPIGRADLPVRACSAHAPSVETAHSAYKFILYTHLWDAGRKGRKRLIRSGDTTQKSGNSTVRSHCIQDCAHAALMLAHRADQVRLITCIQETKHARTTKSANRHTHRSGGQLSLTPTLSHSPQHHSGLLLICRQSARHPRNLSRRGPAAPWMRPVAAAPGERGVHCTHWSTWRDATRHTWPNAQGLYTPYSACFLGVVTNRTLGDCVVATRSAGGCAGMRARGGVSDGPPSNLAT